MKKTVNFYHFERAFRDFDRYDNFGHYGLKALFDYLEDLEEDCGEIELDVIAICCDYSNYNSATEAATEMITGFEKEKNETEEETEARALEELQENTTVIEHKEGIVVQSF